MKLLFVCS